jgi:hypothetical protein
VKSDGRAGAAAKTARRNRVPGLLERLSPFAWVVTGLTVLGFALRVSTFDQSLLGDELSSYWIVHDHSLGDVLSTVRSNAEITPPVYFVLGWLTLEIGGDPEWLRLPSLIAGTATIPLIYLLGARTLNRTAGTIAAAVMALSPFMIYYSVEARAYAVMIALLVLSSLALLSAISSGRTRWWVAYAICSCATLYTHYTGVFFLAAQALWVVWKHREVLRACIIANVAVAVAFAPWIPGFIADNNSPTTAILDVFHPFEIGAITDAFGYWAFGYPYVTLEFLPGNVPTVMLLAGIGLAAIAGLVRLLRSLPGTRLLTAIREIPAGPALVVLLLVSTPIGEAILSALATNVLGARNLNAAWPGLALGIGGLLASAAVPVLITSGLLVLGGYAIGAAKSVESDAARPDYASVAEAIEQRWRPGDVVVDGFPFTPVPLTGLDVYLPQTNPEVRLGLPISDEPFLVGDPVPPIEEQAREVIELGRGHTIFLVAPDPSESTNAEDDAAVLRRNDPHAGVVLRRLPSRFELDEEAVTVPSLVPFTVLTIRDRGADGQR